MDERIYNLHMEIYENTIRASLRDEIRSFEQYLQSIKNFYAIGILTQTHESEDEKLVDRGIIVLAECKRFDNMIDNTRNAYIDFQHLQEYVSLVDLQRHAYDYSLHVHRNYILARLRLIEEGIPIPSPPDDDQTTNGSSDDDIDNL